MKIINPIEAIDRQVNEPIVALLGPVPRSADTAHLSWHFDAIQALYSQGYNGLVLMPIPRGQLYYDMSDVADEDYMTAQMQWNGEMFNSVLDAKSKGVFSFWIPRDDKHMLARYTEQEFYELVAKHPDQVVMGIPSTAVNVDDLHDFCRKKDVSNYSNINAWAKAIVAKVSA